MTCDCENWDVRRKIGQRLAMVGPRHASGNLPRERTPANASPPTFAGRVYYGKVY